jgi:hypothetical protein
VGFANNSKFILMGNYFLKLFFFVCFVFTFFSVSSVFAADSSTCDGTYCYWQFMPAHSVFIKDTGVTLTPYVCGTESGSHDYFVFERSQNGVYGNLGFGSSVNTALTQFNHHVLSDADCVASSYNHSVDGYFTAQNMGVRDVIIKIAKTYLDAAVIADPSIAFSSGSYKMVGVYKKQYGVDNPFQFTNSVRWIGHVGVADVDKFDGYDPDLCDPTVIPSVNCGVFKKPDLACDSSDCGGGGTTQFYSGRAVGDSYYVTFLLDAQAFTINSDTAYGSGSWFGSISQGIGENIKANMTDAWNSTMGYMYGAISSVFQDLFIPSTETCPKDLFCYLQDKFGVVRDNVLASMPQQVNVWDEIMDNNATLSNGNLAITVPSLAMFGSSSADVIDLSVISSSMSTIRNYVRIFMYFMVLVYIVNFMIRVFQPDVEAGNKGIIANNK